MSFLRLPLHAVTFVAAVALASCGGDCCDHDDVPFALSATLTPAEVVPPTQSAGIGAGLATVDQDGRALTASVVTRGVADTGVHIHVGLPGTTGPILFPLLKEAGTTVWTTRVPLSASQFEALRTGNYYFDVHSPTYPNGEIRGRIVWAMPTPEQLAPFELVRHQSATVELQLSQVQEILDADDWDHSGFGFGLTVGF